MSDKPTDRVIMENILNPHHVVRVDATKYHAMRNAMLAVLPRQRPG